MSATFVEALQYLRIHRGVLTISPLIGLLFAYSVFKFKIPKYFYILSFVIIIIGSLAVIYPPKYFDYLQLAGIVATIEIIRVFVKALVEKIKHAWIIVTGYGALMLFSSYDFMVDLNVIDQVGDIKNGYPIGFLFLVICASIYLAREYASAIETVIQKERAARDMEISRKLLEAENKRKSKEIEEAREVQLSLLPPKVEQLGQFEICFYMQTATEVGGDYYDYVVDEDGDISIALGDATGHGMKAGMMVSIIKSLFLSYEKKESIHHFFNKCSVIIRKMKLKNLYMALMILKIKNNRIRFSSAGIPPLLVYSKGNKSLEVFKVRGMPLGAVDNFPYKTVDITLNEGDLFFLMTDGLSELFDKDKNMFGEDRIKEIITDAINMPVEEIIDYLSEAANNWTGGLKPQDDITIIAGRKIA